MGRQAIVNPTGDLFFLIEILGPCRKVGMTRHDMPCHINRLKRVDILDIIDALCSPLSLFFIRNSHRLELHIIDQILEERLSPLRGILSQIRGLFVIDGLPVVLLDQQLLFQADAAVAAVDEDIPVSIVELLVSSHHGLHFLIQRFAGRCPKLESL